MLVAPPITNPFGIEIFFFGEVPHDMMCQRKTTTWFQNKSLRFCIQKSWKKLKVLWGHTNIISPRKLFHLNIFDLHSGMYQPKVQPGDSSLQVQIILHHTHMKKTCLTTSSNIWTFFHTSVCVKIDHSPVLSHLVLLFPKPNMAKTEQHNFA